MKNKLYDGFTSELRPYVGRTTGYLGMSLIGGCHTSAYDAYYGRREQDMRLLHYGWVGRMYEDGIRDLLSLKNTIIPKEHYMYSIRSDFDSRYRGHADIIMYDGQNSLTVIDVKTLDWKKYKKLIFDGVMPYSHGKSLAQVQSYIRHGGFMDGMIVYTPRDIPHGEWPEDYLPKENYNAMQFYVVRVASDTRYQDRLDNLARGLLERIDRGDRPNCTCGFCPPNAVQDEIPF